MGKEAYDLMYLCLGRPGDIKPSDWEEMLFMSLNSSIGCGMCKLTMKVGPSLRGLLKT